MEPESIVALMIVLDTVGLIGIGVYLYLISKRFNSRQDALNNVLDSLDERCTDKFNQIDLRAEEARKRIAENEKTLADERENRERESAGLKESLENLQGTIETRGKELEESVADQVSSAKDSFEGGIGQVTQTLEMQTAELEKYAGEVGGVRFRNELQVATSQIATGDFTSALETLGNLHEEAAEDREIPLLAVKAALGIGDRSRAMEIIQSALETHGEDPDLLAAAAHLYRFEDNRAEQARVLSTGLVRSPDHPRLRFERGLLNLKSGKFQEAYEDLESVLDQGVESAEIRYNLGVVLISLGNFPEGVRQLRRSIGLDPLCADGHHALGMGLLAAGRYTEAVDFLERARDLQPESLTTRLDLAAAYRMAGSPDRSLLECAVARQLKPNSRRVAIEEALAYHSQADFNEALSTLGSLLEAYPKDVQGRRLKAEILMEIEHYEEANQEWQTLIQDSPGDTQFLTSVAESLKKVGQTEAALAWYQRAAVASPQSGEVQISFVREALSQGQYNLAQRVADKAMSIVSAPSDRLRLVDMRTLLALKSGRFGRLEALLAELKEILTNHPDAIPLEQEGDERGEIFLETGLSPQAAKIYSGLTELFDGKIDYGDFDDLVTTVMRSMLQPAPKPSAAVPEPVPAEEKADEDTAASLPPLDGKPDAEVVPLTTLVESPAEPKPPETSEEEAPPTPEVEADMNAGNGEMTEAEVVVSEVPEVDEPASGQEEPDQPEQTEPKQASKRPRKKSKKTTRKK